MKTKDKLIVEAQQLYRRINLDGGFNTRDILKLELIKDKLYDKYNIETTECLEFNELN